MPGLRLLPFMSYLLKTNIKKQNYPSNPPPPPRLGLTNFCLAQLTDFVLTGMNKQMYTGMILVDLQKPFDTLDHGVLQLNSLTSISHAECRKCLVCIDNGFF